MTKEEIVSSLKEQAQEKYDSASFMRMNEGDVLMEAAKMLSAQQDPAKLGRMRWEGCEHCKDLDTKTWIDWIWILHRRFCPNCGKPLTEEAWAELERRINGGTADNKT